MKLFLLEKTGVDIILGCDFLTKYDCKLDFSTATITINGIEIEMKTEPTSISQNDPDRILTDKAKIYQALDPKELNKDPLAYLQSFINHIKQNNPILGFINTTKFEIHLNDNIPVYQKQYQLPYGLQIPVQLATQKLVDMKVIQKSNSNYCSPAFPILKPNNDIRLVVNYKLINDKTNKCPYPVPSTHDLLTTFTNAKYFSTIDLAQGYYQIPVHPNSIKYTTFCINGEQYEFLRMPFGLKMHLWNFNGV